MKILKTNDLYKTVRVSGPAHNYLGLVFAREAAADVSLVERGVSGSANGENNGPRLDTAQLLQAVLAGVADAKVQTGSPLEVVKIEFVAADTPRYEVYREMAREITLAAAKEAMA